MLVVDDGSPDGTADLAEILGKELGNIDVMRRAGKSGLGSAYRAGFPGAWTTASTPASRWTPTSPTSRRRCRPSWRPLTEGRELVIGSRYIPGGVIPNWAWHRRLLSRGGNLYASTLLGLGVADATAGFRGYAAPLLRRLDLDAVRAEGYGFQIEMTYESRRAGAPILEVPIRFVDRVEGESKMSTFIVVEALGLVTLWAIQRLFGSLRGTPQVVHT